ncbi:hypothetical protein [Streptomyces sp. NPDC050355]|uniref:hypothetical protein n=1 Tax=Streptomyces sp. NPDC050355 TaxID=3365609 RepID=UPI0037B5EF22
MTIPTPHQTPAQPLLVRPPAPAPVPLPTAFAPPAASQPLDDGSQPGTVTAYAVAYGGTATAYALATAPATGPVTAPPPDAPTARRTWRTAAAAAVVGLLLTAAGCGVLSLAYPPLERVCQVAGAVATTAGATTAVAATTNRRRTAGDSQR